MKALDQEQIGVATHEEFKLKENIIALKPGMTIWEAEKLLIFETLSFTGHNRTQAARLLGISVRTLRNKLYEYRGLA